MKGRLGSDNRKSLFMEESSNKCHSKMHMLCDRWLLGEAENQKKVCGVEIAEPIHINEDSDEYHQELDEKEDPTPPGAYAISAGMKVTAHRRPKR